jgi:hypothetical protein
MAFSSSSFFFFLCESYERTGQIRRETGKIGREEGGLYHIPFDNELELS